MKIRTGTFLLSCNRETPQAHYVAGDCDCGGENNKSSHANRRAYRFVINPSKHGKPLQFKM